MKAIEYLYKIIFKKNLNLIVLTIALVLLKEPIETLLENTLVKYFISKINSAFYNDLILYFIVFCLIVFTTSKIKKYKPSKFGIELLILFTIFYFLNRIDNPILETKWEFTSLYFIPFLKYSDILVLFTFVQILLNITYTKGAKKENTSNSFYDDCSIGSNGVDKLGYSNYAKVISEKIIATNIEKAFAIGINGKWGYGKTSFIDLIKRSLKGNEYIEINYNPWNSDNPKAIISDFFDTVQEALRPYHSSLSRLILKYSNKLLEINDNSFTKSIKSIVTLIRGEESINSLYSEINEAIKGINKKIIVYIDDLDRLDKDEIIEVIRLIRNTANFHNTFFVVAYDRDYVVSAIKQHNLYKEEAFLEKIFQIEITLPYFNKDKLRILLANKLKEKLPNTFHSTIENDIIGSPSSSPAFLNEWLESIRDVTRLANSIILNYSKLSGEVLFIDFLRIELLRLKYPAAYELIYKKKDVFLDNSSRYLNNNDRYHLRKIKNDEEVLKDDEKSIETHFKLYIHRNHTELSIPKRDIDKIVSLVDGIFYSGYSHRLSSKSHLSIVYPGKFHRYFAYSLPDNNLSEIEFSTFLSKSQSELNSKITDWVNNGLADELKDRFAEIKTFKNKDDFEKIIKSIFYLANQYNKNHSFWYGYLVGYDGNDLYKKLDNYDNKLVTLYNNNIDDLKSFIKNIFTTASSPYIFEADFIRFINSNLFEHFPLEKEELNKITLDYFKNYCEKNNELDNNVWHLYHCCKQTEKDPINSSSYRKKEIVPEKTKLLMKDFLINKDLDNFIKTIIDIEPFDKKRFSISNFILEIYDDWYSFEQEINKIENNDSLYLKEFRLFIKSLSTINYKHFIEFNFDVIPIRDIIDKKFNIPT